MSKADCYQGKAGRCAQVCKYLGWMPPTNTCQTQCTHIISHAGLDSFPRLFSAALIKVGSSGTPASHSKATGEGLSGSNLPSTSSP